MQKKKMNRDGRHFSGAGQTLVKADAVLQGFGKIWESIFDSPVHLDSALSKQPPHLKSVLAQIVPLILLRPASLGEALGVGIPQGEPWCLDAKSIAQWRPAQLMAERIYENMSNPLRSVVPAAEDFPPHFVNEWQSIWGEKTAQFLTQSLAMEAPLGLRVSRRVTLQSVLQELTAEKKLPVRVELSTISPLGIRLSGYTPVMKLDAYVKGNFEIQDEGSQYMAMFALWPEKFGSLLKDRPSDLTQLKTLKLEIPNEIQPWTVIDACAGAGGKSLAMGDLLKGKGRMYAYDTSEKKLQALRRRATRAGLNNIQTFVVPENEEAGKIEKFYKTADRVLVDAPCSGWGVLRRNPDIKWRQTPETLKRMPVIQSRLLELYSSLVKPGGNLTFGVCTFREEETRGIVEQFNRQHPDFTPVAGGYLGPNPCDGFFMQAWVRK